MTRSECENKLLKYSMVLPCGFRTMFIRNGVNPIKKVRQFNLNYHNMLSIIDNNSYLSLFENGKHEKYKGIDCVIEDNLRNNEMWVDIDFWNNENYKGKLDSGFFSILHERM